MLSDTAERLAEDILSHNGEEVTAGEHRIPVSLRIGMIKVPDKDLS